jgi:predicted peptidase
MGGFGAFELAARRPEMFAAVAPICGGGDPTTAPRMARLQFYIVHSNYDPVVPVELSREMARQLLAVNRRIYAEERNAALAERPDQRPPNCWTPAYRFGDDGILDWMFEQRRESAPAARK